MFVFLLYSRLCNISLPGSGYYTQLHNWSKIQKSTNFGSISSKMVSKFIKITFFQLKNDQNDSKTNQDPLTAGTEQRKIDFENQPIRID